MSGLPPHLAPLLSPEAYPHAVRDLRLVETHISWVLLTGQFAYKLKRPVHYSFVDLRSLEHRAFLCAEEVRLNRRFAPQLYVGACRIIAADGGLRVSDEGTAIEHAVRMRQFAADDELDRLVESGHVTGGELEAFGRDLAGIHAGLPRAPESQSWGRFSTVRAQLLANLAECRQAAAAHGMGAGVDALADSVDASLRALEPRINTRRDRVRECHGDLHARNLVRHEGRITAFDCLEFEPAFRWIDVADEAAFLWMDLQARQRPDLALAFLSGYLENGGDFDACRVLRLYGGHRALVRAKVAALEASGASQPEHLASALEQHRGYVQIAAELLAPVRPRLVMMSGLSGSGKTWLARQLAPALGALHLRSDVERKRLAGLTPDARSLSAVGEGLYASGSSQGVHEHLARCADAALAGGFPVLVDATFTSRAERSQLREFAAARGAVLTCVRCHAPLPVLESRIAARERRANDASEADLAVLGWQLARHEPITPDEGLEVIDADTTRPCVVAETLATLRMRDP